MTTPSQSEMLRLFQAGAKSYQPAGLAFESDDPLVAVANIHRLLNEGRAIADVLVRPTGTLFIFASGEQFYTPALRVGADGLPTEKLAEIVSEAGYGNLAEVLTFYSGLPADFTGQLPDLGRMPGEGDEDDEDDDLLESPELC